MMTSPFPRDTTESFSSRRGHGNQLSISDPSHHVTEAIGTLYGDSDEDTGHEYPRDSRPLSFVSSPFGGEQIHQLKLPNLSTQQPITLQQGYPNELDECRKINRTNSGMIPLAETATTKSSNDDGHRTAQTLSARLPSEKDGQAFEPFLPSLQPSSPLSPTLSLRDVQADSQGASQFPITNIDNPNDIAQELSNLQALRRMSMDVGNSADPDLIPFQGLSLMAMPSIAPSGEDDEGDISRLLWVPAKVHPELAPDQFKNFLENRVQSIKRRSGESLVGSDGQQHWGAVEGLSRKKSMLSRQVDSRHTENDLGSSDEKGEHISADRHLPRKTSSASNAHNVPELSLNELVKDPSKVVQRLTLDSQRQTDATDEAGLDDKPILPVPTMGLRRSTRTTYRKGGSLRSGDRVPFSKRSAASRQSQKDADIGGDEPSGLSPSSELGTPRGHSLQRSHSEPLTLENFSRPARSATRLQQLPTLDNAEIGSGLIERPSTSSSDGVLSNVSRGPISSPQTFSSSLALAEEGASFHGIVTPTSSDPATHQSYNFPQRSSSQNSGQPDLTQIKPPPDTQQYLGEGPQTQKQQPPLKSRKRPSFGRPVQQGPSPFSPTADSLSQTIDDIANSPSALPGSGSTRTDSLTFIPTLPADDKKVEKKTRDREESEGGKSTGWKWFKSDDREKRKKEREKERERERDKDDVAKKIRARSERPQVEKSYDGARLDVLQNSIEGSGTKSRESLFPDRDGVDGKPSDDRKKEPNRKVSETKKEKDGFFGSIFGVSRRKESKDAGSGKTRQRITSPELQSQQLRPDIDYPYARFPIVEERAIYRMAHIKLANPRRDLRSQVLLSNFMYSYLAKVQAMHPQLNVPTSPQQKRQDEERRRREQELQQQQYLEQQISAQQQQHLHDGTDQYNLEYHRTAAQYDETGQGRDVDGSVDYIDDAQIFEYDHGHQNSDPSSVGLSQQHRQHQQHDEHADAYDSSRGSTTRGYYDYGETGDIHGERDVW